MAETEIPADVREVAGTISLRVGHTSDGPSALCIAEGLWEAIMADRASRAPDPSREMLRELVEALRETDRSARYLIERQRDQINGKPVRDAEEAWVAWTSAEVVARKLLRPETPNGGQRG